MVMDFLGIAVWIFDFLVLDLLPFVSMVLLVLGIFGIINRLPDTITNYAKRQGAKLARAFKGNDRR
jgi:hypothetical protein